MRSHDAATIAEYREVVCDCCGSTNNARITHKRGCNIRVCRDCGLMFVSPQPDDATLAYLYSMSHGYFAAAETDLSQTSPERASWIDGILRDSGVEPGRLLDVGCAVGQFIYHMQKRGWHTTGIDLNEGALDVARLNGLHATRGTLEECNFENNSFDVIHLGDLIEHVRSPRSLLKEIRRILRPGGMVVIATPNADSGFSKCSLAFSRFTGMSWAHSQAPYHLYEYRPDTLVKLLERSGFEIENLIIHGKGSFPYLVGATGYFDELKRELKRKGRYNFSINLLLALPKLMLVSGVLLPLWFAGRIMDNRHRSGRNIMLTARRRRDSPE